MTVIKEPAPKKNFSIVDNATFSLSEDLIEKTRHLPKGHPAKVTEADFVALNYLAIRLAANRTDWKITAGWIQQITKWSRSKVYRIIGILVRHGYLLREKQPFINGRYGEVNYIFCQNPEKGAHILSTGHVVRVDDVDGTKILKKSVPEHPEVVPCVAKSYRVDGYGKVRHLLKHWTSLLPRPIVSDTFIVPDDGPPPRRFHVGIVLYYSKDRKSLIAEDDALIEYGIVDENTLKKEVGLLVEKIDALRKAEMEQEQETSAQETQVQQTQHVQESNPETVCQKEEILDAPVAEQQVVHIDVEKQEDAGFTEEEFLFMNEECPYDEEEYRNLSAPSEEELLRDDLVLPDEASEMLEAESREMRSSSRTGQMNVGEATTFGKEILASEIIIPQGIIRPAELGIDEEDIVKSYSQFIHDPEEEDEEDFVSAWDCHDHIEKGEEPMDQLVLFDEPRPENRVHPNEMKSGNEIVVFIDEKEIGGAPKESEKEDHPIDSVEVLEVDEVGASPLVDEVDEPKKVTRVRQKGRRRGRETPVPEDFRPDLKGVETAWRCGMTHENIETEITRFIEWHTAHDTRYVSWQACWRMWCLKYKEWNMNNKNRRPAGMNKNVSAAANAKNAASSKTVFEAMQEMGQKEVRPQDANEVVIFDAQGRRIETNDVPAVNPREFLKKEFMLHQMFNR